MLCLSNQMIPVLMTELCDHSLEKAIDIVLQISGNNSVSIKLHMHTEV